MAALQTRMEAWVREQFALVPRLVSLQLRHVGETEERSERITKFVPPDLHGRVEQAVSILVAEAIKQALWHADSFGAVRQHYKLTVSRMQPNSRLPVSGEEFLFSMRGRPLEA
jgi:hypothetical protein